MIRRPVTEPSLQDQDASNLYEKIETRTARVGVIGMGYVGLPTMAAAAEGGFSVIGIDVDESRVAQINNGKSYIEDVRDCDLGPLVKAGRISATTDYAIVGDLDVLLVCVPTPITQTKEPDLGPLKSAVGSIADHMRRGQLVALQSTSFPGTTEEVVLPVLENAGFKPGKDCYLAFALERIDPGNPDFGVRNVPKVVGGVTPECTQMATAFFSAFIDRVVPVSSPKVAEMTKLMENTFRSVNIALVGEMAMLSRRMGIDIWEVIDAASTKPFGFMPFYPGPGVGGHCIPVDPFYLSWKAKDYDFRVNFVELAAEINDNMPHYTLGRIIEILGDHGQAIKGVRLLALGATFKENISDIRNSPAVRVMELLMEEGVELSYSDGWVPSITINGCSLESVEINPLSLRGFDAVLILVNHAFFDFEQIVHSSNLVIDTRNATRKVGPQPNVVKL